MEIAAVVAQFWGWLTVILSLIFLFRARTIFEEIFEMAEDKGFLLVSGYFTLVLGLVTVLTHNLWISDARVVVTIFGWLSLVKGVVIIGFPGLSKNIALFFDRKPLLIQSLLLAAFLLGTWVLLMG